MTRKIPDGCQDDNPMRTIRLNLADIQIERLEAAGEMLGHTSRSETMRWLSLNAVRIANMKLQQAKGQKGELC